MSFSAAQRAPRSHGLWRGYRQNRWIKALSSGFIKSFRRKLSNVDFKVEKISGIYFKEKKMYPQSQAWLLSHAAC
jgi:hypothetical protein